ncbi:MAG: hypothetical protein KatS3mg102_2919 [Planctomycetota bacterium]|nr:MAG: hypothetical protein KatS3mg102_2919 [Planctomycetota bacterium]
MHIADGILPPGVLIGGAAASAGLLALTLRRLADADVPKTAVMTAAFFVGSLIHFPLGGTSVHLVLVGLTGAVLGAAAFPAVVVGLVLQAALFGHGGLTALGVNAFTIGSGALAAAGLFACRPRSLGPGRAAAWGTAAGAVGTAVSLVLYAGVLVFSESALRDVATYALLANLPLVVLEALVSGAAVGFIARVEPRLLERARAPAASRAAGAALVVGLVFACAEPALAHRAHLDCRLQGEEILIEAYFDDGTPMRGAHARVELLGAKGSPEGARPRLLEARLDAAGTLRLPLPGGTVRVFVEVRDDAGHRAEAVLRREGAAGRGVLPGTGAPAPPAAAGRAGLEIARVVLGLGAIGALALVLYAVQRRRSARTAGASRDAG